MKTFYKCNTNVWFHYMTLFENTVKSSTLQSISLTNPCDQIPYWSGLVLMPMHTYSEIIPCLALPCSKLLFKKHIPQDTPLQGQPLKHLGRQHERVYQTYPLWKWTVQNHRLSVGRGFRDWRFKKPDVLMFNPHWFFLKSIIILSNICWFTIAYYCV